MSPSPFVVLRVESILSGFKQTKVKSQMVDKIDSQILVLAETKGG